MATAADPRAALVEIGRLGGMSAEQVEACFADQAVGDYILNARLEGNQKFNVNSTPTLIVNGKTLPGVPGMEEFRQLLDSLAKDGASAPASQSNASGAGGAGSGFFAGNVKTYITIAVVVLIVGGIVFFLLRKR